MAQFFCDWHKTIENTQCITFPKYYREEQKNHFIDLPDTTIYTSFFTLCQNALKEMGWIK